MVLRLMSCSPRRPVIGFTHLENRLKNRDLDDRRFWKRLYYGPSPNVDKTRVFRTGRPLIKRCVHEIVKMRGATQVHNEYARPSDGANVSHVRLPVRLDFREGCGVGRPPIRLERMDVAPVTALDRMPEGSGS